jgi:hypothetical protein
VKPDQSLSLVSQAEPSPCACLLGSVVSTGRLGVTFVASRFASRFVAALSRLASIKMIIRCIWPVSAQLKSGLASITETL